MKTIQASIMRRMIPRFHQSCAAVLATYVAFHVAANAQAATFQVRLVENTVPAGLSNGVQLLDQITLTEKGRLFFGGDTTAATSDDFFYSATLSPFALTLEMQEGTTVVGEPGVVYVRTDAVNDMNESGDYVFVAETDPGVLDSVFKNGASVVREGDLFMGETINSLHHPQIDGMGNAWYLADVGTDNTMDITLFQGSTMIFREGGVIDGVPISSISTSESTSGCNFRVNEAGDYMITIDDGDVQGQDVHIIINGVNVLESGDFIPGNSQPVYWFNQNGLTSTGNHWWVLLSVESVTSPGFAGDEVLYMDGDTVLLTQGQDLGGGLTAGQIQTASINADGHWLARVDLIGAAAGDDALLLDGAIIARTGDPVDANYNWGSAIGFVNDIQLNDCGEFALIADLVPSGGGSPLESLVTGSIFDAGDVNGDSVVDINDTGPFVAALLDSQASSCNSRRADINNDGMTDGLDVAPFLDALLP
ncbi:MAG: hypothetical protein H6819_04645 [Phycisphaerales bacterium]|nr:hypothetical protein [Phycisphaerales bacterium]MCB9856489.1 hypothetical protein [Phycisphaerales bacterium]MCB9863970.1 hypothetical protein [Phycisphaerales bacterium]